MTTLKSTALALTLICITGLPGQAQTADSNAATKTLEEIRETGWNYGNIGAEFTQKKHFGSGASLSVGIRDIHLGTELTELTLNDLPIDVDTFNAIDAFLQEYAYNASPDENSLSCSKEGPQLAQEIEPLCEEIRFEFDASFLDHEIFVEPETGEYDGAGTCSIYVTVRTRDASVWCHGDKGGIWVEVD